MKDIVLWCGWCGVNLPTKWEWCLCPKCEELK